MQQCCINNATPLDVVRHYDALTQYVVGSEQDVAPTIYGMYKLLITYYPINICLPL